MAWKQPSTLMVLDIATIVFSLFFNLNRSYFDDHDQWYKIYTIDSELYWLVRDQVGKDTAFGIIMKIATGTLIFALFSVLYSIQICQPCLDDSWYKITHSRLTVGLNYSFLALFWLSGSWLDTYWICPIRYWVSSLPWGSFSSCPLAMESLHLLQVDCLAVLVVFDWYPEL